MRVSAGVSAPCLLLLGSFAGAQAPAAAVPPPPADAKVYRSTDLHLRYTYPATFTDASPLVGAAFQASLGDIPLGSKDDARCFTLPFSVMRAEGGLSILLLVRADAACLKRTFTAEQLPQFTQGEVQGLSASGAKPQFGDPVSFSVDGHAAEQMQGTFTLPTGSSMHAMVTCILLKPDVACWQFLASDAAELKAMSHYPVTLDGGAPAMLTAPSKL